MSLSNLSLIGVALFAIVPWFLVGLNIWGWLFVAIALLVIGFEIYSVITNKKTLTQLFGKFKKTHPKTAKAVLVVSSLGWLCLIIHLMV